MARYLDITASSHGQPFGTDANSWMQQAYNEQTAMSVIAQIGENYNPSTVYILFGCGKTSTAGTTSVAAGILFVNQVFYFMNPIFYTDPVGPDVDIVNLVTTYGDGTGTVFEDGFTKNVQVNVSAVCAAGTSGSGTLCNYSDLVRLDNTIENRVTANGDTITFENSKTIIYTGTSSSNPNIILSATNARIGSEVILRIPVSSITTYTVAGGMLQIPTVASSSTITGAILLVIRFKYLGNIGGNNYVDTSFYAV